MPRQFEFLLARFLWHSSVLKTAGIATFYLIILIAIEACSFGSPVHFPRWSDDDELSRVASITSWVHFLTPHTSDEAPNADDPNSLLLLAEKGVAFRCVEYSRVLSAALCRNGIPSRIVKLKTADAATSTWGAGHVVVEAYLTKRERWVFLDPQFNVVALNGEMPSSVTSLQELLNAKVRVNSLTPIHPWDEAAYWKWLGPYLYYITVPRGPDSDGGFLRDSRMYVPPAAEPLTVFQRQINLKNIEYVRDPTSLYEMSSRLKTACVTRSIN